MNIEYITREPWPHQPAITWKVTKETPKEGIEVIIHKLKERYNPTMTDQNFELVEPNIPEIRVDTRVRVNIKKDNKFYGNVAIQYKGTTTDASTWEDKTAQLFWVFFNMYTNQISYEERDYFVENA